MEPLSNTAAHLQLALVAAAEEVFTTMLGESIRVAPPEQVSDTPRLSAIIGFAGGAAGFLALHFSRDQACAVAARLLQTEIVDIDADTRDAVGEVVNMVAGGLKRRITEVVGNFQISLPSVIEGSGYTTHGPRVATQMLLGIVGGTLQLKLQLVFGTE
jgi:chemotaxis protein CheX